MTSHTPAANFGGFFATRAKSPIEQKFRKMASDKKRFDAVASILDTFVSPKKHNPRCDGRLNAVGERSALSYVCASRFAAALLSTKLMVDRPAIPRATWHFRVASNLSEYPL